MSPARPGGEGGSAAVQEEQLEVLGQGFVRYGWMGEV